MKARPYPVGNPDVLTRETIQQQAPTPWYRPEQNPYKGILQVRVLPPANLPTPPLLPYRTTDGRLTFPLCGMCANKCQQRRCRHSNQKRSWVTAYTHAELNRALELGYVVTDVHEVWQGYPIRFLKISLRFGITHNGIPSFFANMSTHLWP
jgi:hypothetical protein